LDLNFTAFLHL